MLGRRLLHTGTFRLTLAYAALFGISVLLVQVFIYWSTAQSISHQVDETVSADIDALTQHFRLEGVSGLIDLIGQRTGQRNLNGALYLLTDATGRPLAGNLAAWPGNADDHGRWLTFPLDGPLGDPLGGEEAAYGRAQAVALPGGHHLLVGRDTRALDQFQALMIDAMAWSLAGTLLLGGGGGYLLSRRALGRIDGITRGAERIMRGDIAHRMPRDGSNDEYDRLVDTLNAMLDRIEALMEGVRTVANTVAHDLRSPLTRMRADLERAVLSGGDAEALRTTCEAVMAEADGLLVTFNALLSIAEAEAGVELAAPQAVDLDALVDDLTDLYGPLAEDADLDIRTTGHGYGLRATGSRELLFQALSNLVDNAIKHADRPGLLTIGLAADPGAGGAMGAGAAPDTVDLWVADSGPGIPESERARVLERFVRLDASRTTPGNGLGLSLVAAIARLHRARLTLEDARPGLRVRLRLPRADDHQPLK
jgi:signal transduction histidine kinase